MMRVVTLSSAALGWLLLSETTITNAFVPTTSTKSILSLDIPSSKEQKQNNDNRFSTTTQLYTTAPSSIDSEENLRKELAQKTSAVENEEQYAITEGTGLETVLKPPKDEGMPSPPKSATVSGDSDDVGSSSGGKLTLQAKMDQLCKPRWYPLFVAEKAAEFVESTVVREIYKAGQSFGLEVGSSSSNNKKREKIVILGTGWGAASFLKEIDTNQYDVTVISPRNYFLFTPMLAGASVGTVEYRSITEPVREINRKARYLEGTATYIDSKTKTVSCQSVVCEGNTCDIEDFEVEYDRLVVTVGAQTNTFGIPGVNQYCCYLKQVEDSRRIRTSIINCFERANLPNLTDEERQNTLTFAVIGAGPTGIEFAAELRDFVEQDGPKYYPELLKHVRIKVIEASPTVLAPFDKSLQEEAIAQLKRKVLVSDPAIAALLPERFELTELLLETAVKEVKENTIILGNGDELPYGLAVWAAGNGPLPITLQLVEELGKEQEAEQNIARGRLAVDPWLRAIGSDGNILAFGDCSCITKGQLPATAQVAAQQAEYLAKLMNQNYDLSPSKSEEGIFPPPTVDPNHSMPLSDVIASIAAVDFDYAKPFQFLNLGILAYTGGGTALAQVTPAPEAPAVKGKGQVGNAVWRSVYLSKQVSVRNRLLVLNDWIRRQVFGRDITRV